MRLSTIVASAALAAALAGCSAIQQQQAVNEAKACFAAVGDLPEAAIILGRTPRDVGAVTLEQLSDPAFISPAEAAAISAVHPRMKACQQQFLTQLQTAAPTVAPIFAGNYRDQDEQLLAVMQRKISWGEYNRRRRDVSLAYQERFVAEQGRLTNEAEA